MGIGLIPNLSSKENQDSGDFEIVPGTYIGDFGSHLKPHTI